MTTPSGHEFPFQSLPILIVDDDIWMQRILSRIVESMGFEPIVATNGYEGVSLAVERRPAAIFLDIVMPDLSGHQTLKLLKQLKDTRSIPVLMITAMSDTENLGLAVKEGAAGFIRKPFTRSLILEKLQEVLGSELVQALAALRLRQRTEVEPPSSMPMPAPAVSGPPVEERPSVRPDEVLRRYQTEAPSPTTNLEVIKELLLRPPSSP
ncbi:MAG: response regulator, partial [Candidatus Kapabacteria bacterium]|nr:response regulator [Candidatus Kapabacteria bacterium]MDW7997626.1 response regulator [Bacteroidota bacterium]